MQGDRAGAPTTGSSPARSRTATYIGARARGGVWWWRWRDTTRTSMTERPTKPHLPGDEPAPMRPPTPETSREGTPPAAHTERGHSRRPEGGAVVVLAARGL